MPWYYAPWISFAAGYAVLIAAAACVAYAVFHEFAPKPRRPKLLNSVDVQTALRIAAERTRNERKSKCNCGVFVACDKHSRELDVLDERLRREGK